MRIIFVGTFIPPGEADSFSGVSIAGNQMQCGFLKGFYENGITVETITVTPRAMVKPGNFSEVIFQRSEKENYDGININKIPYINLPIIKQISIHRGISKKLKKLIKNGDKDEKIVIFVYNSVSYFCGPALSVAKHNGIECCGIIADLPIKDEKKGILMNFEDRYEIDAISKFNKLVVLTKHIANDFAPDVPFVVVEAGTDISELKKDNIYNLTEENNLVYTGTLNSLSGMELILDIAKKLEVNNRTFDIYGKGDFSFELKEAEKNGAPIRYHGSVTHEEALSAQMNGSILICPRLPDNFTTRYTFPSKVIEYIGRGKPVICNRLEGIPDEYEQLVNFPNDTSPEAWIEIIEKIFKNYEDYSSKALKAKKYVEKNKNWKSCAKKVLTLFNDSDSYRRLNDE